MTIRAILTDVEGTTTDIAFVTDTLFPYARARLADYVRAHPETVEGPDVEAAIAQLLAWHDADQKVPALKTIQGLIWAEGYTDGTLRGHVYPDAVAGLRRWHARGIGLYVYSSGSVAAQKLLFGQSTAGDLSGLFSGHFDTAVGAKREAAAYRAIVAAIGVAPDEVLFLSDVAAELDAAAEAGLAVTLLARAGGAGTAWPVATGFDTILPDYTPLTEASAAAHLSTIPAVAGRLGGDPATWQVREVGDGNLNLVFLVTGPRGGVAAKQALPYVRLVGESWPLPLTRAYYERLALADQARHAPDRVPGIVHYDDTMALTVMDLLHPHRTLRGELIAGRRFPLLARHMAEFVADTLFATSDLAVPPEVKKARIAAYLGNTAMCRITEDLIFDEPYFDAPMNRHSAALDPLVADLRADVPLRLAVQALKGRFLAAPEALLHGDLHTGSIMVTADDTRVIDPEFAFYGPIGFDPGMFMANLWIAHFAQDDGALLDQAEAFWNGFVDRFAAHWRERGAGALFALGRQDAVLREAAIAQWRDTVWRDALGFAGAEVIRRVLGLAHVADFEGIADPARRAACEARALRFARALLVERDRFDGFGAITALAAPVAA
jgi:5-methylthioribose kinase